MFSGLAPGVIEQIIMTGHPVRDKIYQLTLKVNRPDK
jgi:hypothetical protein